MILMIYAPVLSVSVWPSIACLLLMMLISRPAMSRGRRSSVEWDIHPISGPSAEIILSGNPGAMRCDAIWCGRLYPQPGDSSRLMIDRESDPALQQWVYRKTKLQFTIWWENYKMQLPLSIAMLNILLSIGWDIYSSVSSGQEPYRGNWRLDTMRVQ